MEGRQRRSFTDDYKRQAVDLVASSGRSVGLLRLRAGHTERQGGRQPRVHTRPDDHDDW